MEVGLEINELHKHCSHSDKIYNAAALQAQKGTIKKLAEGVKPYVASYFRFEFSYS